MVLIWKKYPSTLGGGPINTNLPAFIVLMIMTFGLWAGAPKKIKLTMTLLTGNKGARGMTLIEILVSVTLLSVGLILLYQPLLASLDALAYVDDRIQANYLISGKLWELEEKASKLGRLPAFASQGTWLGKDKTFNFKMAAEPMSLDRQLQQIKVGVSWRGAGRNKKMVRSAYVFIPAQPS